VRDSADDSLPAHEQRKACSLAGTGNHALVAGHGKRRQAHGIAVSHSTTQRAKARASASSRGSLPSNSVMPARSS
jgi:hypothetical protein